MLIISFGKLKNPSDIMKTELDTRPVYLQKKIGSKGISSSVTQPCYYHESSIQDSGKKILSKYNIRFHEKIPSCKNQLNKIHKSINQQRIRNRSIQKIKSTNNKLLSNR